MAVIMGSTAILRMPVDLFPDINIPVVVVATFFSGMPPEQIEADITGRFERFFTLANNIEHIESRSLPGVSLIKIPVLRLVMQRLALIVSSAPRHVSRIRRRPRANWPPVDAEATMRREYSTPSS